MAEGTCPRAINDSDRALSASEIFRYVVWRKAMRRITDNHKQVVVARLEDRVRHDARFQKGLASVSNRFSAFLPLNSSTLAAGIPTLLVIELATLARALGLDRLPAPWYLIARCAMQPQRDLGVEDSTASVETWRRYADWFYDHFRMGRSDVFISLRDGYSRHTVQAGVRAVSQLFRKTSLRGRPRREHYAP